jgi:hypothetical protein
MDSIEIIRKFVIEPIKQLDPSLSIHPTLVYCTLSVETLGALIDTKPIRAREQSKQRFASALYHLFPNQYGFVNKESFLYDSLRNHSAHHLVPSAHLIITSRSETLRHLDLHNGQRVVDVTQLAQDVLNAAQVLIRKIETDQIKSKHIADIQFL